MNEAQSLGYETSNHFTFVKKLMRDYTKFRRQL